MEEYKVATALDKNAKPVGWIIHHGQSCEPHIYDERDEAVERCAALNHQRELYEHWPDARDPDVLVLTDDPDFCPDEDRIMRVHKACDQIAQERLNERN